MRQNKLVRTTVQQDAMARGMPLGEMVYTPRGKPLGSDVAFLSQTGLSRDACVAKPIAKLDPT